MNEGFFKLPEGRQQEIINAAYKVFSQNTYKKAPVAEIALEAGISKSLLFYHFKNKKELYLYLWKMAEQITREQLITDKVLDTDDLFEMLKRTLHGKCKIMRKYPYMAGFSLKAYYEQDSDISENIQKDFKTVSDQCQSKILQKIDISAFPEGTDFEYMYKEMVWAADGYMHMAYANGVPDPDKIEQEFERLILFWKRMYLRHPHL